MLNYAWHDGLFRFYSMKGKRVDVYSFTRRHDLISVQNTICNARHK